MSKKEFLNLRIDDDDKVREKKKELFKYIDSLTVKPQHLCLDVCHFKTDLRAIDEQDWLKYATSIEGQATSGSISINGSSAVRRSGSLSIAVNNITSNYPINKISDINNIISLNKKVEVAVGIENTGYLYSEYKIFWFSLGTFLIKSANVSNSSSGLSISVSLTDLMGMLNGELGGTILGETTHSPIKVIQDDGTETEAEVEFVALIRALLVDYGGFNANNIRIKIPRAEKDDNGPLYITGLYEEDKEANKYKLTTSWNKTDTLYVNQDDDENKLLSLIPSQITTPYYQYESVGYQYGPLVYKGNLTSKGGETIVSVLDKIKNTLGNFEYFFDIDGVFHFQEINNGLNAGGNAENELGAAINDGYFIDTPGNAEFVLDQNNNLVSAFTNNPQYSQIKNDFIVWGKAKDGLSALRYHVIITDLSTVEQSMRDHWYSIQWYEDEFGVARVASAEQMDYKDYAVNSIKAKDWRQELYLQYIANGTQTLFAKELIEELPKIYDVTFDAELESGTGWKYTTSYDNVKYYVDAIDVSKIKDVDEEGNQIPALYLIKNLSIDNIGLRTKVINDDKVNMVLEKSIQDLLITDDVIEDNFQDTIKEGLEQYTTIKSAYTVIRSALHQYIAYNNRIAIQAVPMFYLEPNIRIQVDDDDSDIHGDYMIDSLSIPLDVNGTMSISASKVLQRI